MRKHIDLAGQRFGRLVTIEVVGKDKYYDKLWRCMCDCGKEADVVIECNGVQHYESIEFFGGDERLKIQQANDACKVEFAKEQQLRLLVLDCRKVNTKIIGQSLEQFLL